MVTILVLLPTIWAPIPAATILQVIMLMIMIGHYPGVNDNDIDIILL